MKRNFFIIAIATLSLCVMVSCGKKGSKDKDEKDDTEMVEDESDDEEPSEDDLDYADGVNSAPEEDWTEEAVADAIRKAYKEANLIYAPREDDLEPNIDVYAMYCSDGFNEILNKVRAIDAQQDNFDNCFLSGQDLTWNYWGEGSVKPENIQVTLLTGDMAEASFQLTHGQEWMQTKVSLYYENGHWRINDWLQVGDDESSKLQRMVDYINKYE